MRLELQEIRQSESLFSKAFCKLPSSEITCFEMISPHPSHGAAMIWRMVSSGMLPRVTSVRTDVSQELSTSFIRVTRIGELGTTLAVTSNWRRLRRNTKWAWESFLQVPHGVTIPEDAILHSHRREKRQILQACYCLLSVNWTMQWGLTRLLLLFIPTIVWHNT
jgi:hypothetical protein